MGPDIIVVTSVPDKEKDKDSNVIAYDRTCNTYWKIKCRYIPTFYPGTGDAYTSVMIGSLLDGDSLPIALIRVCSLSHRRLRQVMDLIIQTEKEYCLREY